MKKYLINEYNTTESLKNRIEVIRAIRIKISEGKALTLDEQFKITDELRSLMNHYDHQITEREKSGYDR